MLASTVVVVMVVVVVVVAVVVVMMVVVVVVVSVVVFLLLFRAGGGGGWVGFCLVLLLLFFWCNLSQGWICSHSLTGCHTGKRFADQTCCLTLSQYADTGPTKPSSDPIKSGSWRGRRSSTNFGVTGMTRLGKQETSP